MQGVQKLWKIIENKDFVWVVEAGHKACFRIGKVIVILFQ